MTDAITEAVARAMLPSDEIVEAVAKHEWDLNDAYWREANEWPEHRREFWEKQNQETQDEYRRDARLTIATLRSLGYVHRDEARRAALEEAAKVAENAATGGDGYYGQGNDDACIHIAAAIRALANTP
jgi:flagellar biosynthesis/type III secretory pathway protein FliH